MAHGPGLLLAPRLLEDKLGHPVRKLRHLDEYAHALQTQHPTAPCRCVHRFCTQVITSADSPSQVGHSSGGVPVVRVLLVRCRRSMARSDGRTFLACALPGLLSLALGNGELTPVQPTMALATTVKKAWRR